MLYKFHAVPRFWPPSAPDHKMKLLSNLAAAICTVGWIPCIKEPYAHRWAPEISLTFYRGDNCTDPIRDFDISPRKKDRSDVNNFGYGWCSSLENEDSNIAISDDDPPASYRVQGRSNLKYDTSGTIRFYAGGGDCNDPGGHSLFGPKLQGKLGANTQRLRTASSGQS